MLFGLQKEPEDKLTNIEGGKKRTLNKFFPLMLSK